jgi:hypothetical protein
LPHQPNSGAFKAQSVVGLRLMLLQKKKGPITFLSPQKKTKKKKITFLSTESEIFSLPAI